MVNYGEPQLPTSVKIQIGVLTLGSSLKTVPMSNLIPKLHQLLQIVLTLPNGDLQLNIIKEIEYYSDMIYGKLEIITKTLNLLMLTVIGLKLLDALHQIHTMLLYQETAETIPLPTPF